VAWPAPPATERIRLVRSLRGEADLESDLARFWRKVSGADAPVQLYHPVGVAVSPEGDLLAVTDQALSLLFLFDFKANTVRTVAKEALGGIPVGVAVDADVVWVVVPARRLVLAFTREGLPLRTVELEDCDRPTGVAIDAERQRLYVADTSTPAGSGHAVHVHALDTGEHLATLGRRGEGQGELFFPTFLALAPGGGVYVADTMNARVQQLDDDGAFVRQVGERGDQFGQFDKPKGVATDSFGNVYVVDSFFSVVQIFNRDGRLLLFFGGRGDSAGFLSNPAGIAIDAHNRIYVADGLNFRVGVYELVNTTAADSHLAAAPPHSGAPSAP
jgi:DNA-binding beta-propeller fold protein YncE